MHLTKEKIIQELSRGTYTFYASLAAVFMLTAYNKFLPPFIILWGILWAVELPFRQEPVLHSDKKYRLLLFLFTGFYLWQVIGLLYSDSLNTGLDKLFMRLSLLVFPVLLISPGRIIRENIHLLLKVFAVGTFLYLLFCIFNSLIKSLVLENGIIVFNPHPADYDYENYFFSDRFAVKHHPTYLAMYSIFSLIISLESLLEKRITTIGRFIWIFMALIFFACLYPLSSRAGFIAFLVIIIIYFVHKTWQILPKWIVITALFILGVSITTVMLTNYRLKYSLNDNEGQSMNLNNIHKRDERFVIWNAALTAISHNPVLGSGTGNTTAKLNSEYLKLNYSNGYSLNLNTHNQFLEVLLENGLIGLLIFLGIFYSMFKILSSEKNFYMLLFLIMIIIFFLFESMLNRLAGVSFFSLFSTLLIHLDKKY